MFRQGFCLFLLSGAHSQYSESASKPADTFSLAKSADSQDFFEQVCKSSSPICYHDNIHLCVDGNPMNQSKLVHTCSHGCTACDDSPHLCNDEQGKDRCKANADRHVTSCEEDQQGTSFCSGGDVRYCNSSNLAVLVEYCDSRGCQNEPLGCQPTAPRRNRNLLQKATAKGKKGKKGKSPTASPPSRNATECEKNRTRVDWTSMPDKDRETYVQAVNALYKSGDMQKLAQLHYDNRDQIHGTGVLHFLIWHRAFVNDFEERLRALPGFECVTVPFWTYDYSMEPNDRRSLFGVGNTKLGQADHNGCIGGSFAGVTHTLNGSEAVCIQRTPTPSLLTTLSGATFADLVQLSEPSFTAFSDSFQNAHGMPHVAVGGAFATHFSPIDPAFFVHHCNVDRLFALWQDCHNNYEWFEQAGLQTPIIGYEGVTAADVIDLNKTLWKNKTLEIMYSSDSLGDATRYSSDFRRRIATACQNGQLSRAVRPAAPIIGIDDSWATLPSGQAKPQTEDVTVSCSSDTGATELSRLPLTPLSVFDGLSFQQCMTRCGQFYFKNSGPSNCICTTPSKGSRPQAASISSTVSRYVPNCGSGNTYGLYSAGGGSNSRRLLQQMQTFQQMQTSDATTTQQMQTTDTTQMQTWPTFPNQPNANVPAQPNANVPPRQNANVPPRNEAESAEATEQPEAQENETTTEGSVITTTTDQSLEATDLENLTSALQSVTDEFLQNITEDEMAAATEDMNATLNNTLEEWGNATEIESNLTETNSTEFLDDENSTRVCINPIAPPAEQAAAIACSSDATRPPAIPEAWMRMNNLNLAGANPCAAFRPSNATRSFDCAISWA